MKNQSQLAQTVFPAGSNGEFNLPPELSIVIQRGAGCELWDVEGKRFLDFSMGWGSALVGHARQEVTEAVIAQAARGSNFAYVTEPSLRLAERICALSPACEQIRFCASGTEATMYCLRLARAVTGKPLILKFEGAYHGANDTGVTSLFPSNPPPFPQPDATSAGLDPHIEQLLIVAPFNDWTTTEAILQAHADRLAGVIVEPLQRCVPPEPGFLESLRQITRQLGMMLIFDEVVTGFRLAYGGAQEYYGVIPDLIAYGKALGGGYSIGAYGASRDILSWVREDRLGGPDYVWTASTLGGNPISTTAALAAIDIYRRPETYPYLHDLGNYLREGMRRTLQSFDTPSTVIGDGPLAQVVFAPGPVRDYRTSQGNKRIGRALMLELFRQGIFLNPMGTKLYLSLMHTRATCDEFLECFASALQKVVGSGACAPHSTH